MARKSLIPDPLQRRHELEKPLEPAKARAIGEAYVTEQREIESLAFLEKGAAADVLETLCAAAIERGDAFLLREANAALGREPERDAWERLGRAAEAQGREKYAAEARRQVERLGGRRQ